MLRLSTVRIVKLRRPAMPVIGRSSSLSLSMCSTMNVPGSSGRFVLRMFREMPFSLTGRMDSSCSTEAPMNAISRSSA